jgi:hypothetical protein
MLVIRKAVQYVEHRRRRKWVQHTIGCGAVFGYRQRGGELSGDDKSEKLHVDV